MAEDVEALDPMPEDAEGDRDRMRPVAWKSLSRASFGLMTVILSLLSEQPMRGRKALDLGPQNVPPFLNILAVVGGSHLGLLSAAVRGFSRCVTRSTH